MPSIAVVREPISRYCAPQHHCVASMVLWYVFLYSNFALDVHFVLANRLLSAWFYRGHSPNLDFFQVRPEFKDIKDGKRPRVVFSEYLEMPEYQNIQTRMLGADSFPYRNITITDEVLKFAHAFRGHHIALTCVLYAY